MDSLRRKPFQKITQDKPLIEPVPQQDYVSATYTTYPIDPRVREAPSKNKGRSRQQQPSRKRGFVGIIKKIVLFIFICIIILTGYFFWKINKVSTYVYKQDQGNLSTLTQIQSIATSLISSEHTPLRGENEGRINILLLGKAGKKYPGRDLTDTVMIMSIDTKTHKVGLLSLPRDLYVPIPDTNIFTKINAVYQAGNNSDVHQGEQFIEQTVTRITGLPIHYFLMIDFDGFEKVIDTLGGVNVEVMRDIYDPRYPGPNYSYETFKIQKGWQKLDGATALKYVRERHDDPEGDFGRAKRQQQVIQAVKSKAFSIGTFVNVITLNNLLTILGESVVTNIKPDELESFISLSKQVDTQNIANTVIDAWKPESLLRVSHVQIGPTRMFILVPRIGNYNEIRDVADNLFRLEDIQMRREKIQNEQPTIAIINQSSNANITLKLRRILNDFGFENKNIAFLSSSTNETQDVSLITDNTNRRKPFSLDEILKKLPLTLSNAVGIDTTGTENTNENQQYDFIITIGNDLNKDLDFEEDSPEEFKQTEDDNIAYPNNLTQ